MSNARLFPGQGTQFVGMGQDLLALRSARDVFEEADEALGWPLSQLVFEGPEEELAKTSNAQPAILTVSLAYLAAFQEQVGEAEEFRAQVAAGHSLGQYTALVAAGALKVADAVPLVWERGRLMQLASEMEPGGMAAIIGLAEIDMEDVCRETGAEIANVNSSQQIVVSGTQLSLAQTIDLAKARGAKHCVILKVAGAFHSSLMSSAWRGLSLALAEVKLADPEIPVIANTTGERLLSAQDIRKELEDQLCCCVQWKKSVESMVCSGTSKFFEIGPGNVLSGLVKRIVDPQVEVEIVSLNNLAAIRDLAA